MVAQLHRDADVATVRRSAVLAARVGDPGCRGEVHRPDRGHARHRSACPAAASTRATFCGVCRPRRARQREHGGQGAPTSCRAPVWARTPSSAATTASPTRSPPTTIRAAAATASSARRRSSATAWSYPVWNNVGNSTLIRWNPILNPTQGSNFKTHSLFVNDQWRVTDRATASLGLRYDRNDGVNSAGVKDVEDSKVSPRLGLTYDLRGDGDWIVNAQLRHVCLGAGQRHRELGFECRRLRAVRLPVSRAGHQPRPQRRIAGVHARTRCAPCSTGSTPTAAPTAPNVGADAAWRQSGASRRIFARRASTRSPAA